VSNTFPFIGSLLKILVTKISKKDNAAPDNEFVLTKLANEIIGTDVSITPLYFADVEPTLHISDPKIV